MESPAALDPGAEGESGPVWIPLEKIARPVLFLRGEVFLMRLFHWSGG